MEFIPSEPFDANNAQRRIWSALRDALADDEGVCYYRYPVFSADRSRREPDILILHRQWGLFVIECKGCHIENVSRIEGSVWIMENWHSPEETPYPQAEDQMFMVLNKFRNESCLRSGRRDLIQGHVFIGLPFITKVNWKQKGLDVSPASPNTIIFADDLEPEALRARLQSIPPEEKQESLTNEQWLSARSVLQGVPVLRHAPRPQPNNLSSKAAFLREAELQIKTIDREQENVAVPTPAGPQRIRGLAGSGKTVVLSMKAACMHAKHPEWDIAYTFYTRGLYGMIKSLITRFYRYWTSEDPNWDKLKVVHGWGAKDTPGLYSLITRAMQRPYRTYTEAKNYFSYRQYNELLGTCCKEILESNQDIPELFDAILIDEAQDFHFAFDNLCYAVLREPKRLIWAYDDVQSLESLAVPTTIDIFGTKSDGTPVVSLEGVYADGVEKELILKKCYRTPRPVLVAAHIFGMGLLRPRGAVQFIFAPGAWEDIGYEILAGKFEPGEEVTIRRPEVNSPHALEKLVGYNGLMSWKAFNSRQDELNWIAEQIRANIEDDELKPEEIAVISLDWKSMPDDFDALKRRLLAMDIKSARTGSRGDMPTGAFAQPNHVTLSSIFHAKGNEAPVVYVMGFEQVDSNPKLIVQERNMAFTAMTRTRGWCILTGVGKRAELLFQEIEEILSDPNAITFKVPDPKAIQRNLDNLEYERRRNTIAKAQQLMVQLDRILVDEDYLKSLDPELRKRLIEKLKGE